jgi:threonine synthase
MDVGDPSNFVRILELMQQDFPRLKSCFSSVSISDEATKATLQRVFKNYQYLMDPHGAVGFLALENYLKEHPGSKGIFLETAHPVKFYDVVEPILEQDVPIPESVASILHKPKQAVQIDPAPEALRDFLKKM